MAWPAKVARALLGAIGDSDYSELSEAWDTNEEHRKQVASLPSLDDKSYILPQDVSSYSR